MCGPFLRPLWPAAPTSPARQARPTHRPTPVPRLLCCLVLARRFVGLRGSRQAAPERAQLAGQDCADTGGVAGDELPKCA